MSISDSVTLRRPKDSLCLHEHLSELKNIRLSIPIDENVRPHLYKTRIRSSKVLSIIDETPATPTPEKTKNWDVVMENRETNKPKRTSVVNEMINKLTSVKELSKKGNETPKEQFNIKGIIEKFETKQ